MSLLINQLSGLCKKNLLHEKRLISLNHRIGYQIVERIVRNGISVINLRIETLRSLVFEIISGYMASHNVTFISDLRKQLIIGTLFYQLQNKMSGYLSRLDPKSGLFSVLLKSIEELRMAGISRHGLKNEYFEEENKGKEIIYLLSEYEEFLDKFNIMDYPGALFKAIQLLESGRYIFKPDSLIIIDRNMIEFHLGYLEKRLFTTIPEQQRIIIQPDDPVEKAREHKQDLSLLGLISHPFLAAIPKNDGSVSFFMAKGESNEVREIFRRISGSHIPLDEVEIIHTDYKTYVPLVYEIAHGYCDKSYISGAAAFEDSFPVTFAEGLPLSFSRPGRALEAWISWIRNDYPQTVIKTMIQDGLIKLNGPDGKEANFSLCAKLFGKMPIVKERNRYLRALEVLCGKTRSKLKRVRQSEDEEAESFAVRKKRTENEFIQLKNIEQLLKIILDNTPEPDATHAEIIQKTAWFLDTMVRCKGEIDQYAMERIKKDILICKEEILQSTDISHFSTWDWLILLLKNSTIMGQGPRPGKLYVTNLKTGGYSGRKNTFIAGLDDARFPGPGLSDPILLDPERRAISDEILLKSDVIKKNIDCICRLFGRLNGHVTLSYSCLDIPENRELFPSSILLSAYRIISGNQTADYEEFNKSITPSASFIPSLSEHAVSLHEWCLSILCGGEQPLDAEEFIGNLYPDLEKGIYARKLRRSEAFTEYDGYVAEAGQDNNPYLENGLILSANKLELLGRSPFDFFLKYILNLEPDIDDEIDTNVWIDHIEKGNLLHEVFQRYMAQITGSGELPSFEKHKKIIHAILSDRINVKKKENPPYNKYAFQRDVFLLRKSIDIFLKREEDFCKTSRPAYFEVSVGTPFADSAEDISSPDPVRLSLNSGKTIKIHARIDRIDKMQHTEKSAFSVWDYKTGSSRKYKKDDPFISGKVIQNILYLLTAEKILSDKVTKNARVKEFGFFFTSLAELGRRISWTETELRAGKDYLILLADMISAGCFPCSPEANDYIYSDYAEALIDMQQSADEMIRKIDNEDNKTLDYIRRLRSDG